MTTSLPSFPSPFLSPPPLPTISSRHPTLSIPAQFDVYFTSLHSFLSSFTYKSTPGPEHTPNIQQIKSQPMRIICQTSNHIITNQLPIKCLEAVVIATQQTCLITNRRSSMKGREEEWRLTRMPLRFQSTCEGHRYWHIVLVLMVEWGDEVRFGAVSLSRHSPLSYRSMVHSSLSSLCSSFRAEYHRIGHRLLQLTLGLPFDSDPRSQRTQQWHFLSIPLTVTSTSADDQLFQPLPSPSDDTEELQVNRLLPLIAESDSVKAEWRVVSRVLDRYSVSAMVWLNEWRVNERSPSNAKPLTVLHPMVHWQQRTGQMVYEGGTRSAKGGSEKRRSTSDRERKVEGEVDEKERGWNGLHYTTATTSSDVVSSGVRGVISRPGSRTTFAI